MSALSFGQKMIASALIGVIVISIGYWSNTMYMYMTIEGPARGGIYTEAIFGQPTYFNPLLVSNSNDAEASVVELVYAGLFKADAQGQIVKDIAQDISISDDGREYTVKIRDDVRWHDGEQLTADDVMFTFGLIKNQQFEVNPVLQDAWADIALEQIDDYTVKFVLKKPYAQFIAYLRTGLLPEHIWSSISPESFALSRQNTKPIGAGKYIFDRLVLDENSVITKVELRIFDDYFAQKPYIERIEFSFFDSEQLAAEAYSDQMVMGTSIAPQDNISTVSDKTVRHDIAIPTYFAVFLNPLKSASLGYAEVRQALSLATDRQALVDDVLVGRGMTASSPLISGMMGYDADTQKLLSVNMQSAQTLLQGNGWIAGDDGIRAKDGTVLRFSLVVPEWDNLQKTAKLLVDMWRKIGVDVQIVTPSATELATKYLSGEHDYEAILYGQSYFSFVDPDPYPFWHSTQKKRLNFAQFGSKKVDKLLEQIQSEMDEGKRNDLYRQFSNMITKESPAVFLYSPYYAYVQDERVGGVSIMRVNEPSERFSTISDWYLRTKRVLK